MSFSLFQGGIPQEGKILLGAGGDGCEQWVFSSSKRKSSWRNNPPGRGEGGRVSRENISKRYCIKVSMRFFPSSKRKSSYSFTLGSCHEFFSSSKRKSSRGEFPCGIRKECKGFHIDKEKNPNGNFNRISFWDILPGDSTSLLSPTRIFSSWGYPL